MEGVGGEEGREAEVGVQNELRKIKKRKKIHNVHCEMNKDF